VAKIFGIDVQSEIASAITASDMPNFLLRKKVVGLRDPVLLSGGTNNANPNDYACHGMVSDYSRDEMQESPLVQKGDKRVTVIAKPLDDAGVEPEIDDFLVDGTEIYTIIDAKTNSARAVWILQCRG
jgi:hypothetical protein